MRSRSHPCLLTGLRYVNSVPLEWILGRILYSTSGTSPLLGPRLAKNCRPRNTRLAIELGFLSTCSPNPFASRRCISIRYDRGGSCHGLSRRGRRCLSWGPDSESLPQLPRFFADGVWSVPAEAREQRFEATTTLSVGGKSRFRYL